MENLDKGYIKLYRSVRDNWVWEEKPFSRGQAWIDIILSVNHKETKILFNGSLVTVKRGTCITSIRKLAARWGWSLEKTVKFLNELKKDGMIDKDSNRLRTLITVEKYSVYQDKPNTKPNTKKTRSEHTPNTEPIQTMNDKGMIKNEKEYKGPSDGTASADSDDDDEGWMSPDEARAEYERMKQNEKHV